MFLIDVLDCGKLALTAENTSRVDLQLESDKEEDDDDDDDDHDEISEADDEDENSEDTNGDKPESEKDESSLIKQPTIQIQFAVGTLDENPMMKILAQSDSDESDDENTSDPSMKEDEDQSRKRTVEDMLSHEGRQMRSYESPTKKKKTKSLITELL